MPWAEHDLKVTTLILKLIWASSYYQNVTAYRKRSFWVKVIQKLRPQTDVNKNIIVLHMWTVTWWTSLGAIEAWSWWPTSFLQCFDTVVSVIRPVKVVPKMTYGVSNGMLILYSLAYSLLSVLLCSDITGYPSWRQQWRRCTLSFYHCWWHWTTDHTPWRSSGVGCPNMMYSVHGVFQCLVFLFVVCLLWDHDSYIWLPSRSLLTQNGTVWSVFSVSYNML